MQIELVEQIPDDPWTLIFAMDFMDLEGDIGLGDCFVFVGADAPVSFPLVSYFLQSQVDLSATSGRVALPLRLGQGVELDGSAVRYGFQVRDSQLHMSNCYAIDMQFAVSAIKDETHVATSQTQQALGRSRVVKATQVPCP